MVLLWVFYPDAIAAATTSVKEGETSGLVAQTFAIIVAVCSEVLSPGNFLTIRFWAFLYLVLCVGSHMAPSGSDYEGAGRGIVLFTIIVVIGALLLTLIQNDIQQMTDTVVAVLGPMFAVLVLTIMLCSIATVVVYALTSFVPRYYRVQ